MNSPQTMIDGVMLTELRVIGDSRGAVLHMLRSDSPEFTHFGECYFSEVLPGAVKAWKRHRVQTQNLAAPVGRIRIVMYDDRANSATRGRLQILELGRPDAYLRLRIPPGVWYGFVCISVNSALLANCADMPHDPAESDILPVDTPSIPYAWQKITRQIDPPKVIPVSRSVISEQEKRRVSDVLDRQYLGMGSEVQQFETALNQFFGRPVVCVVNGTAALHLAVQACGIGAGDEVLVPSLTYVASFQAISAAGSKPVPCEIDPETCVLDWRDAERRLTPRAKAVMPVHYGGGVGDLDGIYSFARRHGLRVIEDAAHAFGSDHRGQRIGGFGDVACFSFDGIKNITSGEGGCVVTEDAVLLRKIQDARLLGVEKDTEKRYSGQRSWEFDVMAQGWRYHMSNIMAAIGLEQLNRFKERAAARQRLARRYDELLSGHPRIRLLERDYESVVPHIYVIRIRDMADRNDLRSRLLDQGIQTGVHYYPNHRLSFYQDPRALPLPVTDAVFPELLTLPLHPALTEEDVENVCRKLKGLIQ